MKIGLLMPRSGLAGMWTPAADAVAAMTAAELNAAGGVLGAEVELTAADCGLTARQAIAAADFLLDVEEVDAVVGMHTSNIRDVISQRLAGRVPYVYSAQYEGVRCGPATIATGSVDYEILRPAINWFMEAKRAERFYFVGNDYVWPRAALEALKAIVAERGAYLVGESFVPLRESDNSAVLADIARARPDAVVQMLIGQTSIDFNRAFAASRLDGHMLRFAMALDETVLTGIGPENSENLFSGSTYFGSLRSRENDRFLELYHDSYGDYAPPVSAIGVSFYEGINVVAGLARRAGRQDGHAIARLLRRPMSRAVARHVLAGSPAGEVPRAHIAKADGAIFNVVASI